MIGGYKSWWDLVWSTLSTQVLKLNVFLWSEVTATFHHSIMSYLDCLNTHEASIPFLSTLSTLFTSESLSCYPPIEDNKNDSDHTTLGMNDHWQLVSKKVLISLPLRSIEACMTEAAYSDIDLIPSAL